MQIYVLISVAMMLLAKERADPAHATATDATMVGAFAAAWAPCLLGAVACWLAATVACRRFDLAVVRNGVADPRLGMARWAERFVRIVPWLGLAAFGWALFGAGWMEAVRAMVGDTILLDEMLTLLPPMITVIVCWWFLQPLQWRLRSIEPMELAFVGDRVPTGGEGDVAEPPPACPSRFAFVLQQIRFNLLLLLVPMLAAIGLSEAIRDGVPHAWPSAPPWTADLAAALGVAGLFVASPWLVRVVLETHRLSDGELRRALLDVCGRHGVRVSDLLVWRTRGTMLNGAVVGLVPALRYVLLTDALILTLPRDQLLAVMAHEVGHVRRRHMLVAALGLVACAALASMAVDGALAITLPRFDGLIESASIGAWRDGIELGAVAIAGGLTLLAFGAVSRRLERQADVFAVAHLSHGERWCGPPAAPTVTSGAVEIMCDALDAVCVCSGGDPRRRSWRHGSIAARQAYLRTLVGAPLRSLSIDRQVRWIAAASIAVVVAAVVMALR